MKKIYSTLSSLFVLQLLITVLSGKDGGIFGIFWNNMLGRPNGGLFIIFLGLIGFVYLLILVVRYTKGKKIQNNEVSLSTKTIDTEANDSHIENNKYNINNSFSKFKELSRGKQIAIILSIIVIIGFLTNTNSNNSSSDNSNHKVGSNNNSCYGTESCINNVRQNFTNTGKQILSEQYLGNGKFGISFLDPSRGEAYNSKVSTDCNCKLLDVDVSIMR